jgi:hypothetical protein
MYAGDQRPSGAVARIHNSDSVYVESVDDQPVAAKLHWLTSDTSYPRFTIELEPGEHRVAVRYATVVPEQGHWQTWGDGCHTYSNYVVDSPAYVASLAPAPLTLRYRFEPGRDYTFWLRTTTGPQPRPGSAGADAANDGTWTPLLVEKGGSGGGNDGNILATPLELPPQNTAANAAAGNRFSSARRIADE